jgi:hypothetical protein
MEVQIDRKELKKVSGEFRTVASRLLSTSPDDSASNLRRFITFIENNAVIHGFLEQKLEKVDAAALHIKKLDDRRWNVPTDADEEVVYVYSLLKFCDNAENKLNYYTMSMYYHPSSSKYQDHMNAFNKSVVLPFISQIEQYLRGLMIDAGEHDEDRTGVHVSNGSVYIAGNAQGSNLAAGSASISESTASYTDARHLVEGVSKLREYMDGVPDDKKQEVEEAIDVLVTSASGEIVPKSVIAAKVELVGNSSSQMQKHLTALAVGAGGSVASHGIIQAIQFVLGKFAGLG